MPKNPKSNGAAEPKSKRAKKEEEVTATKSEGGEFGWEQVGAELKARNYLGNYGAQNGVYQAVAEAQIRKDLNQHHCQRSPDEFYVEELKELLEKSEIRKQWHKVISFNPDGMLADRPTIAATYARMDLPDIAANLIVDGKIVYEDKSIQVIKAAIEPVWNLPRIASRLGIEEPHLRDALCRYTKIPEMTDLSKKVFLPQIGGTTVYFFGDPRKLADPHTEVAVRVHDECNGSDVFCTDICTCRPYLLFAIQGAVECAQRGGVGIVAYYRKEGRSLGEVTKFRVYNARKHQKGGDRPETYFKQTENIAGIRDARLQELMPDVLSWLGITQINWLLSMSSDKYDAITKQGITVLQRVSLPEEFIPRDASVEINAKISAGYHCEKVEMHSIQTMANKLESIRDRCNKVYETVKEGHSQFFTLHEDKLPAVVDRVMGVFKRQYNSDPSKVPYHSRARHFELSDGTDLLQHMFDSFPERLGTRERVRRLIDVVVVSVLTDAGAGSKWTYYDKHRKVFSRSEGLAMASYEMFLEGTFSSDRALPLRANSMGLKELTEEGFIKGYQITEENPMIGVAGRVKKLQQLGQSMEEHPEFFGAECARAGNMIDYLLGDPKDNKKTLDVQELWEVVIKGMSKCWPAKTMLGLSNGDVWQCMAIKEPGRPGSDIVPFHKLPQWLMYSLIELFERFLGVKFSNLHLLTGLAEYRNGGLFVDDGVIELKGPNMSNLVYDVGSEVVVQWRALTIVLLDKTAELMREKLKISAEDFPLAKVLQAGTWQAGREAAKEKRSDGASPINTYLDGTVF